MSTATMPARPPASTLWILVAGNTLVMISVGFFVPILPIYLGSRGASPAIIGAVFAAGIVGRGLMQYPGGWLADHWGRRPLMLLSMGLYSLAFLLYLLPLPAPAMVAVRFLHAAVSAGYFPAAAALLADVTPVARRARAFGVLRSSDMFGFVAGPALGGALATVRLDVVFVAAAVTAALAAGMLLFLPRVRAVGTAGVEPPRHPLRMLALVLPIVLLGTSMGYTIGAYDSVWSLYMVSNGAGPLLVGLSFTLFAAPMVVLGAWGGSFADRFGPWRVAVGAGAMYGLFGLVYAFVSDPLWLTGLGVLEGILIVPGSPALAAMVSRVASAGEQGRAQGAYNAGLSVAQVVGALASGVLFGLRPAYAFLGVFAVAVLVIAAALAIQRRPLRAVVSAQP